MATFFVSFTVTDGSSS